MTKQEQNSIIIAHIDAELREQPDIQKRIGIAFNNWFQQMVTLGTQTISAPAVEEEGGEDVAA